MPSPTFHSNGLHTVAMGTRAPGSTTSTNKSACPSSSSSTNSRTTNCPRLQAFNRAQHNPPRATLASEQEGQSVKRESERRRGTKQEERGRESEAAMNTDDLSLWKPVRPSPSCSASPPPWSSSRATRHAAGTWRERGGGCASGHSAASPPWSGSSAQLQLRHLHGQHGRPRVRTLSCGHVFHCGESDKCKHGIDNGFAISQQCPARSAARSHASCCRGRRRRRRHQRSHPYLSTCAVGGAGTAGVVIGAGGHSTVGFGGSASAAVLAGVGGATAAAVAVDILDRAWMERCWWVSSGDLDQFLER
jgi:hypothetical protein